MELQLLSSPSLAFLALFTGMIFGFLLRKATVSRFDVIVGQLLLKDFTVMKVILTAIVVGSIGIYSLSAIGLISEFHLSTRPVLLTLVGGSIFGIGMAVAGYCPGTAIAAIAEGSKDMLIGVLGMVFGAILFSKLSFALLPFIEQKDCMCQQTLASVCSLPNWTIIISLLGVWMVFALGVRKLERRESLLSF